MRKTALDKGYIDFLEQFGDELTIVNAARVSFNNWSEEWANRDAKLLKYLWTHKHMSPFRHVILRVRIHAPEFVMRQLYKHVVGIESTSNSSTKDHSWNEQSARYVCVEEYYIPEVWRAQSKNNKQGSEGKVDNQKEISSLYQSCLNQCITTYEKLLEEGVAKEQARIILPFSQYTTVIWTASLEAILNFISLRLDEHSQYEIREYARLFQEYIDENFPTISELI